MDCLFCKIAAGEVEVDRVAADDDVIVIRDIEPQSPVHLLAISRVHVRDATELAQRDPSLLGRVIVAAVKAVDGLCADGYRIVINTGRDGHQTVPHLHVHVLGGRSMAWPPG